MIGRTLLKEHIDSGQLLIEKLTQLGVSIDTCFWKYNDEVTEWKLYIAVVNFNRMSMSQIYSKIQSIAQTHQTSHHPITIGINDIGLLSASSLYMQNFKHYYSNSSHGFADSNTYIYYSTKRLLFR